VQRITYAIFQQFNQRWQNRALYFLHEQLDVTQELKHILHLRRDDKMGQLMRRRFAAAIVVCLVAMASWAPACDLACSLPHFHSVCKLGVPATSEMPPDMDMSDMNMSGHSQAADAESVGSAHLHANYCTHSPCNEISISAISKSAAQHRVHVLPLVASGQPIISASIVLLRSSTTTSEPSDLHPFDPPLVSLRI
jgi:hypothetical protein